MVKQIDDNALKKGEYLALAIHRNNPEAIEHKYNIKFTEDCDDLDYVKYALFFAKDDLTNKEDYFMFQRHLNSPELGTEIWVLNRDNDIIRRIQKYLLELGMEVNISWWCDKSLLI
ncbi:MULTISPECIES: hypothetical protein [Leptospira]|uniref:hypothetical protein n=1 Tax=Leptospira TaxID=171 RepID=UPI0005190276|nr:MULTISPECIES: hypothetical protein [Leptospira]ASV12358.1 hypothetical protein B2G51_12420 [Leptospira santarosai]AVV79114.1 Uncharacterized protein XB15_01333 [Leptospira santarosai]KXZ24303.1 hypothetical protein AYB33_11090 [Leptospira santarosai]MDI7164979.1 hypothetical protein [Leptospira santarosai]MDI7198391.1 hypothetical protein [Leptospira santarosai]